MTVWVPFGPVMVKLSILSAAASISHRYRLRRLAPKLLSLSKGRATTAWPLMTAMVVTQVVIAAAAFLDSPSTATMWFH